MLTFHSLALLTVVVLLSFSLRSLGRSLVPMFGERGERHISGWEMKMITAVRRAQSGKFQNDVGVTWLSCCAQQEIIDHQRTGCWYRSLMTFLVQQLSFLNHSLGK